jgi:hypothetical protein
MTFTEALQQAGDGANVSRPALGDRSPMFLCQADFDATDWQIGPAYAE